MPIQKAFEQINTLNNNKLLGLYGIYAVILNELKYRALEILFLVCDLSLESALVLE